MGVKVRLDRNISDNGKNEREVLRQAVLAARGASVPLMIHHTNSTVSLETVLQSLSPGDVYTHTLSQFAGEGAGIVDRERRQVEFEPYVPFKKRMKSTTTTEPPTTTTPAPYNVL